MRLINFIKSKFEIPLVLDVCVSVLVAVCVYVVVVPTKKSAELRYSLKMQVFVAETM